jgi:integrase
MAKFPGLWLRGNVWQLRVVVPTDLRHVFEKTEIPKSLGTSDLREAKRRYLEERSKIERQFTVARDGLEAVSEANIQCMVRQWFDTHDRQWAEADFNATGYDRRAAQDEAHDLEVGLRTGSDDDAMSHVQMVADAILIGNGWPGRPHQIGAVKAVGVQIADVDKTSDKYWTLVGQVRRAMLEATSRHQARLKGKPAGQVFDPAFTGVGAGAGRQTAMPAGATTGTEPPLTEIFKIWKAERKPSPKTTHEWTTAVRRFTEVCGDLPVDAITTANVRGFKDALLRLPAVTKRSHKGKTVPQIIAAKKGQDGPTLSAGTINKQLTAIRALLSWCRKNGYVDTNVAAQLSVPKSKNAGDGRLPYTVADMTLLLAGLKEQGEREPSKLWLPLLAASTGARLEELGQLRVTDVRHRDGIDYISVNTDDEGKSLKTRSSHREVPIHPELVRCGFLDHVAKRRSEGGGRLFPDLRRGSHGKLTAKFSQWWTKRGDELGVRVPRKKTFHSFRHSFKEACRNAEVGEEIHDALTGHSGGGVGRTYGGVPLRVKDREIAKVSYLGLDLSRVQREGHG